MASPPICIWNCLRRIGVHVIGADDNGELNGLGKVPSTGDDKKGIIYNVRTRDNEALNNLETWVPCGLFKSLST